MSARHEDFSAAQARIWERSKSAIEERVATVESAVLALLDGELEETGRRRAQRESHRLAGTAGTFGFHVASQVAAELENLLASPTPAKADVACAARLVEQLREALDPDEGPTGRAPSVTGPTLVLVTSRPTLAQEVSSAAGARGLSAVVVDDLVKAAELSARRPAGVALVILDAPGLPAGTLAGLRTLVGAAPSCVLVLAGQELGTRERLLAAEAGVHEFADADAAPPALLEAVAAGLRHTRHQPATVLVLDDDPLVLDAVSELLAPTEMQPVTLADPLALWDVLAAEQPDLLLLDVDMPEADGLQLCRLLRADERWRSLPLVFLSAHDPERVAHLYAAGADDFVAKPVGSQLIARLRSRLERTWSAAAGESRADDQRAAERDSAGVDVVVVEDDEVVAELLRRAAESAGFSCLVIRDGQEALDQLTGAPAPVVARTVLLDVDLPSCSGIEVLRALRRTGVLAGTSVTMVTGRSTEYDVTLALAEGASDHIAKPFSIPVLTHKLRRSVVDHR